MILASVALAKNIRNVTVNDPIDFLNKEAVRNKAKMVKIIVFAPEKDADSAREAMSRAGAGKIGNYTFCSFSVKGTGRFKPAKGSHPTIGKIGKLEEVREERIEITCEKKNLRKVLAAIKKVHPYEEPVIDIYSLESY